MDTNLKIYTICITSDMVSLTNILSLTQTHSTLYENFKVDIIYESSTEITIMLTDDIII